MLELVKLLLNDLDLKTFGTGLRDSSCKESLLVNKDFGYIIIGKHCFVKKEHPRRLIRTKFSRNKDHPLE